jgi:SAM-dependent methyltransferase
MSIEQFEPRRFQTAARHYLAGRPAYADRLISRVAQLTGLTKQDRVLDLGCGPGQLAIAFAAFAKTVVGVDPEPEMLRIARARAPQSVQWIEGSSYDLGLHWGSFRLVTMGRSFHWMDRQETLRRLDGMIEPGGAVALFHDSHEELPENAWWPEYRAVLQRYEPDTERQARREPGWVRHQSILLRSAFSRLEEISIIERREASVDRLVERALSMSSTSKTKIGERADDMAAEIRALMAKLAPDGQFTEIVATQALIATRE